MNNLQRNKPRIPTGFLLITILFLLPWAILTDASRTSDSRQSFPQTLAVTTTAWKTPQDEPKVEASDPSDQEKDNAGQENTGPQTPAADQDLEIRDTTSSSSSHTMAELLQQGPFQRPFILELHGEITFNTQKFIKAGLDRARSIKADLIVLDVDSPGGGAAESMEIGDMLANITFAPTVAFISREATSGGALSALGCQYIVMKDGATIGDIGVIRYNPIMDRFQYAPAKIRSILVAKARALSERHGRAADLAEAMVDEFAVIYQNENDPTQFRLVSSGIPDPNEPDKQIPKNNGVAPEKLDGGRRLVPESRPGRFLTLTSARAAELSINQNTVASFADFEKQIGVGGNWSRKTYAITDRIVDFLNSFWITGLLLLVGIIALFIEISAPGISVGGLIALLCFSLFFWSHFAGGTAGWLEVTLFLLGLVFLAAEVFVIPGFGVAGLMGIGLVVSSLTMACLDFLYPQTTQQWGQLSWTLATIMSSGVGGIIGIFIALHYMGDIPLLNRFTLQPPEADTEQVVDKKVGDADPRNLVVSAGRGAGLKVGDEGMSESVLRPAGRARISGRSVDVVADSRFIDPDRPVVIVEVRGNRIIVSEKGLSENDV